jgi:hypothetical protein
VKRRVFCNIFGWISGSSWTSPDNVLDQRATISGSLILKPSCYCAPKMRQASRSCSRKGGGFYLSECSSNTSLDQPTNASNSRCTPSFHKRCFIYVIRELPSLPNRLGTTGASIWRARLTSKQINSNRPVSPLLEPESMKPSQTLYHAVIKLVVVVQHSQELHKCLSLFHSQQTF